MLHVFLAITKVQYYICALCSKRRDVLDEFDGRSEVLKAFITCCIVRTEQNRNMTLVNKKGRRRRESEEKKGAVAFH